MKQLEFSFMEEPCRCTETTRYDDLCSVCLKECLEWMAEQNEDLSWEEHG